MRYLGIPVATMVMLLANLLVAQAQQSSIVDTRTRNQIKMDRLERLLSPSGGRSVGNGIVQLRLPGGGGRAAVAPSEQIPLIVPDQMRIELNKGKRGSGGRSASAYEGNDGRSHLAIRRNGSFTASIDTEKFEVTIDGSPVSSSSNSGGGRAAADVVDRYDGFSPTYSGGVATFIYAGANYMVTFDCKDGGNECIDAAAADRYIEQMVLCNMQGKCLSASGGQAAKEIRRGAR